MAVRKRGGGRRTRGGRSVRDAAGTRRKLLRAGRRAFARKGHAGTLLKEDVLDAAGVSVGSFYHQFDDKTGLLLAVLEEGARRLEPRRRAWREAALGRRSRAARAEHFYATLLDWARRNRDLWRIGARERFGDERRVRRLLVRERERWIADLAELLDRRRRPAGDGAGPEARRLAEWMVRLAYAAADDVVGPGGRGLSGLSGSGIERAMVGFTLHGARGLGSGAARAPRG